MATLCADRRLYVTADRSEIVEENDPRSAYLLAAQGRNIGEGDVALYGLSMSGGRVVLKSAPKPEDKQAPKPEDKSAWWPLKMSPADYLKRNPKGKHAALAHELIGD